MEGLVTVINKIKWDKWLMLGGLAGFLLNLAIFFPGYMSSDTLNQLAVAENRIPYHDWHPPVMALVWSVLIKATNLTSSMLILQLGMLWTALTLLSIIVYKQTRYRFWSALVLAVGILPFIINISGVIWKDVQMTYALLLAAMVMICLHSLENRNRIIERSLVAVSFTLLMYAALLRYNALPAIIPLVVLAALFLTRSRLKVLGIVLAFMAFTFLSSAVLGLLLDVEKRHPSIAIKIDDIVHVYSAEQIESLDTDNRLRSALLEAGKKCTPEGTMVNYFWSCVSERDHYYLMTNNDDELNKIWINGVKDMPFKYLHYRMQTYWLFLSPVSQQQAYTWHNGIDRGNIFGIVYQPNKLADFLRGVVVFFSRDFGFLYRPYTWLLISLAVLVIFRKRFQEHKYRMHIIMLCASAALYILSYVPIVAASDYRYAYWSVFATIISLILVFLDKKSLTPRRRRNNG